MASFERKFFPIIITKFVLQGGGSTVGYKYVYILYYCLFLLLLLLLLTRDKDRVHAVNLLSSCGLLTPF